MLIDDLKKSVREIGARYANREDRSKRIFIENRAYSLQADRDREFAIKKEISERFQISYASVAFCGSSQLGFSIHKDTLFTPRVSDLDVACISADLFQFAWIDVIETTRGFTDKSRFVSMGDIEINVFQEQIYKRGMIRIDAMPKSHIRTKWVEFERMISRKHNSVFRNITIAIYMNEYAFCLKQDTSISTLLR